MNEIAPPRTGAAAAAPPQPMIAFAPRGIIGPTMGSLPPCSLLRLLTSHDGALFEQPLSKILTPVLACNVVVLELIVRGLRVTASANSAQRPVLKLRGFGEHPKPGVSTIFKFR